MILRCSPDITNSILSTKFFYDYKKHSKIHILSDTFSDYQNLLFNEGRSSGGYREAPAPLNPTNNGGSLESLLHFLGERIRKKKRKKKERERNKKLSLPCYSCIRHCYLTFRLKLQILSLAPIPLILSP